MISALSRHYNCLATEIDTDVEITNPISGQTLNTIAIWDTGATSCVITKDAANALNLQPISQAQVRGVHGTQRVNVYFVQLTLNNKSISIKIPVTECSALSDDGSKGVLIGMNVITKGDFCISNLEGKTTMTFRIPAIERFDFVAEIRRKKAIKKLHEQWMKHGNDKCPCGSGKKYKNCCGKD